MFAYIKGILTSVHPSYAVVEASGIGYALLIHPRLQEELPPFGAAVQFYTSFVVREASQALYGFLNSAERDFFEVLMNITGVGPKLALSLIGHLAFHDLQSAILSQDLHTLCKVPGVGKKTAERLIVELKDKIPQLIAILPHQEMQSSKSRHIQDALLALINLGYHQNVAQKALHQTLKDLPETTDAALLVTAALRNL